MRLISAFIIVVICSSAICADPQETPKLPNDAQRALDAHIKEAAKLQADFDREIAKRVKALQESLTKSMEAATKRGDLDGAIAIRTKIAELVGTPDEAQEAPVAPLRSSVITQAQADALRSRLPELSEEEWKQLPGVEVNVDVNSPLTMSSVRIREGEQYLLMPCATDRWASFSWEGNPAQPMWAGLQANGGALVWTVDGQRANGSPDLIVSGEGRIGFYANFGGAGGRSGTMRVKILKIR